MERGATRRTLPLFLALVTAAACGAPGGAPAPPAQGGVPQMPPQRKAITIVLQGEVNALAAGMNQVGIITTPSRYFHEFVNAYLTFRDRNNDVQPWIAEELPALDKGTWKVADDGRMELSWRLHRGVKWHDGKELTADDVKFGWQAARDPATQLRPQGLAGFIDAVDTPDPYTVIFHWPRTTYRAGELSEDGFDVLPRHVLEEPFSADKENLSTHPYFAEPDHFLGAGAYRPVTWDRGAQLTVEAFDQYFLGRPKIDRVTFTFVRDANTAMANVLAGAVDISLQAVPVEQGRVIQDEWARTGGGTVAMQLNHVATFSPSCGPSMLVPRIC